MHISVSTTDLQTILETVGRVSTKHVTLPVLQCVVLEATKTNVVLRATNLEIAVEGVLEAEVKEEGMVAVPASVLLNVINTNTSPTTTLQLTDGTLVVKSKTATSKIKSIPHDEFPTIARIESGAQTINRQLFALGIKTAAFAASQSSIKPELGSVYVYQKKEHSLTFVATDSFRLIEKTVPQKGISLENPLLIPQKNAQELARICDGQDSDPELYVNDNQIALAFSNGIYITSRLTTGSFPDYQQIIPKEFVTYTTVLREDMISSFKKTNIFLNKFFQVSLAIDAAGLTIASDSGEVGTTTETISAQTDGEDLVLNFNQRYLAEALPHFTDESVTLQCAGIGRPMVIVGVNDVSVRYLVMPMKK